jgi:hypothetical protein
MFAPKIRLKARHEVEYAKHLRHAPCPMPSLSWPQLKEFIFMPDERWLAGKR